MTIDPLANMQITVESLDMNRVASIYFNTAGDRAWTKAWFNDGQGEPAVEVSKKLAASFIRDDISKDDWLSRFFPKQMAVYRECVNNVRQQFMNL